MNNLLNNPIVKREIKQTFRKPRIFWIMAVYLFALAGIAFYIFGVVSSLSDAYEPQTASTIYFVVFGMQMVILTFITPITTSTAISGEKERQTFDLLIITKTSMYDIIIGKLLSSVMLICIMLILSMPVYAVVFYYGGVSVIQFIFNIIYLLSYVSMIGALGICFSTTMKKSTAASTATVSFIFAATIGVWIMFGMAFGIIGIITRDFEIWRVIGTLFIFNPIVSFISIIDSQIGSDVSWEIIENIGFDFSNKYIFAWHLNIIFHIIATHFLIKFAAKRIAPIRRK